MIQLPYGKAICYSGYRMGQSPHLNKYPSYQEIKEDLLLLADDWDYIRLYDPSCHAKTVLQVIKDLKLPLKVMLGVDLLGEISNPDCSWGGEYSDVEIQNNIKTNEHNIDVAIFLANQFPDIIVAVSAGNEAVPEWNENLVSPERVLELVRKLKNNVSQMVTYCDNCAYWHTILTDVAAEVDLISVHSYPAWAGYSINEALNVTIEDYTRVKTLYPNKQVLITEAGWPTKSGGKGIKAEYVSEEIQERYFNELHDWSKKNQVPVFFFEAFDEPWKGGKNPEEPEKNWGVFKEDRTPKKVLK
ncbi:MAG: glycosyl hydrolase [Bacilli bacterium]|nr:glycosyl hydrolase [Bacilli bacterium]